MLSDKYIAGLIDSDGYIGLQVGKRASGEFYIRPRVCVKQVTWRDKPLQLLAEEFQVKITTEEFPDKEWNTVSTFVVTGDKAIRLLQRVQKHLVIKCDLSLYVQMMDKKVVDDKELKEIKAFYKTIRNSNTFQVKNYPSRKWLAGYFDGDGMIRASLRKGGGVAVNLRFFGYKYDRAALELIQKVFKGTITNKGENALYYNLNISAENVEKVLGYFQQHTIIKKKELEYVYGYIRNRKHLLKKGYLPVQSDEQLKRNKEFVANLSAMKHPPASTK